MNCIRCGRETADYPFHVLTVHTLHVRDVPKEKRVQALGDFEDHCLCRSCAQAYLKTQGDPKALRRKILPWVAVLAAGAALLLGFWQGEGVLRLLGLGMVASSVLCILGSVENHRRTLGEYRALSPEEAEAHAAWACFLESAPKKSDINDLTYIPINQETLARKNGDLMLLYDLLPEIAVEAHKRIHAEEE